GVSRERAAAALAERAALAREWADISPRLEEANAQRRTLESIVGQPARVALDRARPRWTPALREVAMATVEGVEILNVHTQTKADDSGACEIRVSGTAGGAQPRQVVDRFREAMEEGLKRTTLGRPVSARFEQLEDEPGAPGALAGQRRAAFVIVVSVASANLPEPK
ncbi:MAG: hypothetical protein ABMA13_23615, partial [Chthoniobacteraceae bacterium]